ncbi:hypothetical protein Glove_290g45 [Diversispora epigaea]|uniref:Uncharacterized protein n=1 Tax=Diversispora epigaea TaxID=1348612 RepID=A0A397I6T7_9GLOM|nr:hypothetical protein Glove_290g45 [Diversispora epigaea]
MDNTGQYWTALENTGRCWTILGNSKQDWTTLGNARHCQTIIINRSSKYYNLDIMGDPVETLINTAIANKTGQRWTMLGIARQVWTTLGEDNTTICHSL